MLEKHQDGQHLEGEEELWKDVQQSAWESKVRDFRRFQVVDTLQPRILSIKPLHSRLIAIILARFSLQTTHVLYSLYTLNTRVAWGETSMKTQKWLDRLIASTHCLSSSIYSILTKYGIVLGGPMWKSTSRGLNICMAMPIIRLRFLVQKHFLVIFNGKWKKNAH